MGSFRRACIALASLTIALAAPSVASATQFKGTVNYWGAITIDVTGTTVTALTGKSGPLRCPTPTVVGGIDMVLAAPVTIVDGRFHAEGAGKLNSYGTPTTWSIDASISVRRTITGTVTATATGVPPGQTCAGTFDLAAVVAPRPVQSPPTQMFSPVAPVAGSVGFDYRHQVITHLVVQSPLKCPSGAALSARFDSTSYSADPIQVNRGRFKVVADALDVNGVVVHLTVTGTIKGRRATGRISASRGNWTGPTIETCANHGSWTAEMSSPGPAPVASSSGAFYDVTPYRVGRTGAWTYSLLVHPTSCGGGVVAVRFTVAGTSRTVKCGASLKLGPLTPQRTYLLKAAAVRRDGSAVALADSNVYVPGDDGDWVRVK